MIHSSAEYLTKNTNSFDFWIGNFFDGMSRMGVPIFIMISGALMLDEKYEFDTKKLCKHITKLIIFFVFWSLIYCLIFKVIEPCIIKHEAINIIKVIGAFIQGHYHLWFIYLIIGLYLIVPLLRLWVKDENKKYVEYFIILSIIFTYIIPQIINIGSYYNNSFKYLDNIVEKNLQIKYIGGFTAYFIIGWYIHNYKIENNKMLYMLGFLGLLVSVIGTYVLSTTTGRAIQMYSNLSINVLFQSVAMFLFIKSKFINKKDNQNKFITSISQCSLGIYAIHVIIITCMYKILGIFGLKSAIINIPIVFIISFFISYIISFILLRIPILKRVV